MGSRETSHRRSTHSDGLLVGQGTKIRTSAVPGGKSGNQRKSPVPKDWGFFYFRHRHCLAEYRKPPGPAGRRTLHTQTARSQFAAAGLLTFFKPASPARHTLPTKLDAQQSPSYTPACRSCNCRRSSQRCSCPRIRPDCAATSSSRLRRRCKLPGS